MIQMAQYRIHWNLPAVRQSRIVVNQRPAKRVKDESNVKLAAANHLVIHSCTVIHNLIHINPAKNSANTVLLS